MRLGILFILATTLLFLLPGFSPLAHSSPNSIATLSVTPSIIGPLAVNQTFFANVTLYLPQGLSVGAYDLVLKVHNITTVNTPKPSSTGPIIQPKNITTKGSIFPADQFIQAANCVNAVGMGCKDVDGFGVAHSAVATGIALYGPLNGTVFTVGFKVLRAGAAILAVENDTLVNGTNSADLIPHAIKNGLFSNVGVTAFYNVLNAIPIVNRPVFFDASKSFNPMNQTAEYRSRLNYSWSFGDGQSKSGPDPFTNHTFTSIRSYTVRLTLTDEYGMSASFQSNLATSTALGIIQLGIKDQTGSDPQRNVTVTLLNGSQIVETGVKIPPSNILGSNSVILRGLSEGTYVLDFSGKGVTHYQKLEQVTAGWTTLDTIYLTVDYPPLPAPPDLILSFLIGLGVISVGVVFAAFTLVRRRGKKKRRR